MCLGLACTNAALGWMNANLVETIKATEPIPSVALAALLIGERTSVNECLSLTVVVVGVMMMSYTESTLALEGLAATIGANCMFALANNISKLSFARKDCLDALTFWHRTVQVSIVFAAPAAIAEFRRTGLLMRLASEQHLASLLAVVVLNGCAFFTYNRATCEVLIHVTMLCHSVLNTVRRAVMITAAALFFGSTASATNLLGAGVTSSGFVLFILQKRRSSPPLPVLSSSKR